MRILELPLIKRFDEKLPWIFKVKVITQFWKALMFYARQCRILCLSRLISCFLKDQDLGPLKTRSWVFKDQISGFQRLGSLASKDQNLWSLKTRVLDSPIFASIVFWPCFSICRILHDRVFFSFFVRGLKSLAYLSLTT